MEPKVSLPHPRARLLSFSSARSIQSMPPRPTSWRSIHFNIIIPSLPRSSKWFLSVRSTHQNPVCTCLDSHMCHMTSPIYPQLILLDLITRIIFDEDHRRNLSALGGGSTMGIRNFNLRRNEVTKRGKNGLNQSLIYVHPFPPLDQFFIYTSSTP